MKRFFAILFVVIAVSFFAGDILPATALSMNAVAAETTSSTKSTSSGKNNTALIIIDVQNDYFAGGKYSLYNSVEALANVQKALKTFRENDLPIIHVQHFNPAGTGFFEPNTKGVEIHKSLTPRDNEYHVVKNYPDSYKETNLLDILKENNITELVLCGMQTNVCVEATTKSSKEFGIKVTLLEDACAARDLKSHHTAIGALSESYADVIKTSELDSKVFGRVNTALIIIDVQNDYFAGGKYSLYNSSKALANVQKVLKMFRESNLPIIHVQHFNPVGTGFFEPNTKGVEIHKSLTPRENEYHVVKYYPDSFKETDLLDILRENNIDELILCGMQTNVCVEATTKSSKELGIKVTLLEDACAARSLELHDAAIDTLMGSFASIIKTSDFTAP